MVHPIPIVQPIPMVQPQPQPIVQPQQMVQQQPFVHIGGTPQTIVPKLVHPEPPKFGCLKNGSLPTFRANKTVRNETAHNGGSGQGPLGSPTVGSGQGPLGSPNVGSGQGPLGPPTLGSPNVASGPGKKLDTAIDRIRARLNERATRQENNANFKMPKSKPNKLIRRTYHVGKDKFRPSVGVLLPNRTIRNKVTNKSFMLKNTPIEEIRKYLLKQGFIKVGSSSPNDVLRKMYESIIMIDGEIKNYNPDNLLYNFFNDKS